MLHSGLTYLYKPCKHNQVMTKEASLLSFEVSPALLCRNQWFRLSSGLDSDQGKRLSNLMLPFAKTFYWTLWFTRMWGEGGGEKRPRKWQKQVSHVRKNKQLIVITVHYSKGERRIMYYSDFFLKNLTLKSHQDSDKIKMKQTRWNL